MGCWQAALAAEGALVAKGVCGVSGQEPGRQRAWAAEATATLAHRELQEAAQQSFGAVFQIFGSFFQSVGAFAGNIF